VNRGEVATGESQIWIYEGIEGDMLVVRVMADNPANWATRSEEEGTPENGVLDTFLSITAPDGSVLTISPANGSTEPFSDDIEAGTNTDSMFELTLPDNGLYRIEVSGAGLQTGGSYSLIIESESLSTEISD